MTNETAFDKKFNSMRAALLLDLRDAPCAADFDPDLVLRAFAAHLQEISPMHNCPRWETIRTARGWTIFLQNFIKDKKKLEDGIYNSDPEVIDAYACIKAEVAEWVAQCAKEKEEKAREKARAARKMKAFAKAEALGFICD